MQTFKKLLFVAGLALIFLCIPKQTFAFSGSNVHYSIPNLLLTEVKDTLDIQSNLNYEGLKKSPTYLKKTPKTTHKMPAGELMDELDKQNNKQQITVKATAYTAKCTGCSGTTKTGLNLMKHPDAKVIAVDPDVIPLGSTIYVPGYGVAKAADTGGAIDGHHIDVYFESKSDAREWGVKNMTVTIIS